MKETELKELIKKNQRQLSKIEEDLRDEKQLRQKLQENFGEKKVKVSLLMTMSEVCLHNSVVMLKTQ